jgi:nitrogen-specific signal transduction histidine kinase
LPKTLHFLPIALLCFATVVAGQSLQERMLQAEDARPTTDAGLAPLREGLQGNGRRTAIRAIGRLERPEMIAMIAPALNDGVGIRAEDMDRLFVEFQQFDATTTKKYPGTGLGLALTKKIVEAQGGKIGVRSDYGRGSTFYAILPRFAAPEEEVAGNGELVTAWSMSPR